MAVFDGKVKTRTRIAPDRDAWEPRMGALDKGQCPPEKALVHGDRDEVIEGNLASTVRNSRSYLTEKDCNCTIRGNHTVKEMRDLIHSTDGNHRRVVNGTSILNYVGPVTALYVAPLTETHQQPRQVNEPTTWFEAVQQKLKQYYIDLDASVANIELTGASVTVAASDLYFKGSAFGFTVLGLEDTKWSLKKEDAKVEIHSLTYTKVVVTNIQVTGLFLISGTSVSAGPKLAPNSICM